MSRILDRRTDRLPSSLLGTLLGALVACSAVPACGPPPPSTSIVTQAGSAQTKRTTPATPPTFLSFQVSAQNLNVDRVGLRDGYQKADGARDLVFELSLTGTVDALFVISTNAKGEPVYGLRADTLVGNEEIPTELGGVIDTGKMTVGIGVADARTSAFVNNEVGGLHLPDGRHDLVLYMPNTATLNPGSNVRVYVKAGDVLYPGPITPY
ncbi:MAG: hypothetical protein JWP97_4720 [Labilithrix sp.]|nr:hypothetical protein [Labilithrix sp.]